MTYQDLARIDIGILDFSKAYDVVPDYRLLNKLQFYGTNEVTCNRIQHFLAGRHQKSLVDGVFSKEESVDSGVPLGTVLGPIYSSSFSLTTSVTTSALALPSFYLQTIALYTGRSIEAQILLQKDLTTLENRSITWGMSFNPSKCRENENQTRI